MSSSALAVMTPRTGICRGCGKEFHLGGSTTFGYTVPTHHSEDIPAAKRGDNCSGNDRTPKVTSPTPSRSSFT